jgi:hypothetical protein
MTDPLPNDRFTLFARLISNLDTEDRVNGRLIILDHFTKHRKDLPFTTREGYEAGIVEALKSERTVGVYGSGKWVFKASVTGPDGKLIPMFVTMGQRTDGSLHGTAFGPSSFQELGKTFRENRENLGNGVSQPVRGGLEKLEAEGKGLGFKQKELRALQDAALIRAGAYKLAGGAAHIIKIIGPILAAMALARQSQAAELAAQEGRLPAAALTEYKALASAAIFGGVVDPTIVGSDIAANKAFTAFADRYGLDQRTREELNPSISGLFNAAVLTPEQQKFFDAYQNLPSTTDSSYAPEINQMIELKNMIEDVAAQNGKPLGRIATPDEAASAKNGVEIFSGLQSLFADTYLASRDNPQATAQIDRLAATSQRVRDLAATPALRNQAAAMFDSLPTDASTISDPSTKRLIEARNALRERLAVLDNSEKAGRPVAGYYGTLTDRAYEQFYQAVAREKITAEPQPIAPMSGLTPHRSNVASLSSFLTLNDGHSLIPDPATTQGTNRQLSAGRVPSPM